MNLSSVSATLPAICSASASSAVSPSSSSPASCAASAASLVREIHLHVGRSSLLFRLRYDHFGRRLDPGAFRTRRLFSGSRFPQPFRRRSLRPALRLRAPRRRTLRVRPARQRAFRVLQSQPFRNQGLRGVTSEVAFCTSSAALLTCSSGAGRIGFSVAISIHVFEFHIYGKYINLANITIFPRAAERFRRKFANFAQDMRGTRPTGRRLRRRKRIDRNYEPPHPARRRRTRHPRIREIHPSSRRVTRYSRPRTEPKR